MELGFLIISIVKIAAIVGWIYGLLWALGHSKWWVKIVGVAAAFGVIQLALSLKFGDFRFDRFRQWFLRRC
jgi:hypothetical protein